MIFIISAFPIASALMVLLAGRTQEMRSGVIALQRICVWSLVLQFIALVALLIWLGPVARAWLNLWGLLLLVGVVLMGMAAPLAMFRRSETAGGGSVAAAAALVVAGGFLLRTVIVFSPHGIQP
jgi:protein NrfD